MIKKYIFLSGLIFIFVLLLPLFLGFFKTQKDSESLKLFEMNKCIQDKQIPCRWVPDLGASYGYPLFNYHAPAPFYFGEVIYLMTNNFALTIKVMFATGLIGAYLFTYFFATKFFKKSTSVLLAIFYTVVTFLNLFFFPDSSMGQTWGMMFFPLVLLGFSMLSKNKNILFFEEKQSYGFSREARQSYGLYVLLFILSLALLTLSSSNFPFFLLLIILWIFYQFFQKRDALFMFSCLIYIFFSFLLSAFYFLPVLLENNLIYSAFSFDYLPRSVKERPQPTINRYQILTGESEVYDFEQGSNWFKFKTDTKTHTIIRISQYYFPQWKILVDGKEANVEYKNNSMGLMTIILGEGNHIVEGKLFDTPIRLISNILSITFFLIFFLLLILQFKKTRQWISYYRKRID